MTDNIYKATLDGIDWKMRDGSFTEKEKKAIISALQLAQEAEQLRKACGSLNVTDDTLTEDNFSDKMSKVIMNVVDVFGGFPEQRIDDRAWGHLLIYCPQIKELKDMIRLSYSHVDGRDLFAELKPRNTLDIIKRVDGKETVFEADWITDLGDQLRKLEYMLSAAPNIKQPTKTVDLEDMF